MYNTSDVDHMPAPCVYFQLACLRMHACSYIIIDEEGGIGLRAWSGIPRRGRAEETRGAVWRRWAMAKVAF
jgi:hypothetical protein